MGKIIRVGACNHCGLCCHPDCQFIVKGKDGIHCSVFHEDVISNTGCTRETRIKYPSYTDRLPRTCSFRFVEIDGRMGEFIREVTRYRKTRRNIRGTTILDETDLEWEV